jgi:deoxycytidylate deaminase
MQVRIKDGIISVDYDGKERDRQQKMNRREIEEFLQSIYEEGVKDGKPDTPKEVHIRKGVEIAADAILKALEDTKGIGEKRRESIMDRFRKNADHGIERNGEIGG